VAVRGGLQRTLRGGLICPTEKLIAGTTSRWCLADGLGGRGARLGSLGPADLLVYLDTGTGLDANREYVEEFADAVGAAVDAPDAGVLRGPRRDRRLSGPAEHGRMYRKLKERQIGRLATLSGGRGNTSDLHLWTGVRRQESERRMANVTPEQDGPRWTWHAPIHDWSKQDCREYVDRFDLPQNDLWDDLGAPVTASAAVSGRPRRRSTSKPPATSITPTGCGTSNVTPTPTTSAAGGRGEHSPTPRPARSVSTPDR